jgi:hypothetical protein
MGRDWIGDVSRVTPALAAHALVVASGERGHWVAVIRRARLGPAAAMDSAARPGHRLHWKNFFRWPGDGCGDSANPWRRLRIFRAVGGHSPEMTVSETGDEDPPPHEDRAPGCAARSWVPSCVGFAGPGSDTSLDYRERTISRTEIAILANRLISAEAIHVPTAERARSRARTSSGKWSRPGAGR